MLRLRQHSVIPGFGLTLGYTLSYLSLIVLIPMTALALKGASDAMKDLFFSNMSERAAKIMKEDITAMGPVRLKDVEEAQQTIVSVTKDLADRGEITIVTSKDDDELIF